MRNFKVTLDLSDCFAQLKQYKLIEFNAPFLTIFIQAQDPDEVCHEIVERIINRILEQDSSLDARIVCREVKKFVRFDKIEPL